jgi:monoamine oxidase
MKRRDFLLSGLAAASGSLLPTSICLAQASPQARKVVIIGAGLSGLVAAYELSKLNFDVTVLEAQSRPGGRVHTLRSFDEPNLYAEAGAARIPRDHDLTLKYIREFNLPLAPFYPTAGKFIRLRDGRAEQVDWDKFEEATSMVLSLNEPEAWQKIRGGNDQLPKAFASRLGSKIRYNSPVARIEPAPSSVVIKFAGKDGAGSITGDFLISAIPFTMLSKIEISPALSQAKMDAIRSLTYESASRVFVETRRRIWHDQKLNGFGFGENATEIWDSTLGQPGTHGILQTYIRGGSSLDLTRKAEPDRIESTVAKLDNIFPQVRQNFVRGVSRCWSEDPWVLGAWAHVDGRRADISRRGESRIFFAGEHLSNNASWMQGALQSGLRVVKEIVQTTAGVSLTI